MRFNEFPINLYDFLYIMTEWYLNQTSLKAIQVGETSGQEEAVKGYTFTTAWIVSPACNLDNEFRRALSYDFVIVTVAVIDCLQYFRY